MASDRRRSQAASRVVTPMRYITSHEYQIVRELMEWAQQTLIVPHPELRRARKSKGESVCPFLYPSMEKGLCHISFTSAVPQDAGDVIREVRSHVLQFNKFVSASAEARAYASLIVVFTGAKAPTAAMMDQAHDEMKTKMIRSGFMIARFHPNCEIGSVWNEKLPVFRSPVSFFAIRYMAPHDIYFLRGNREFFAEYDKRFSKIFQQTSRLSSFYKPIIVAYRLAKARHKV